MPRLLLMAALLVGGTASPVSRADDRPNVLLLLSDDQRPDTIHALGNEVIRTPHLDRLVHEGTSFTRAITAIPICVASRAELLTGRDGLSNGRGDYGFTPTADARFWAEAMRDAGYVTGYVGKWHTPGRPSERGYLHAVGLYAGGAARELLACPLDFKGMPATGYRGWVFQTDDRRLFLERGVGLTPDISEDFAAAAIAFLRQPRSGPFCLHVNFTAPHDPLLLPTRFRAAYDPAAMPLPPNFAPRHPFDHGNAHGRDEQLLHSPRMPDETRRTLAVYYAVIEYLDEQVGRILAALEAGGGARPHAGDIFPAITVWRWGVTDCAGSRTCTSIRSACRSFSGGRAFRAADASPRSATSANSSPPRATSAASRSPAPWRDSRCGRSSRVLASGSTTPPSPISATSSG